ncbi:NOT4 [Candida margitis]|uniref:NOT4 n=1 Tax=Candida margitis TaxID=1775924 RepID=UPI0022264EFA|nr:NOT4 [Candida margitis]KAI5967680.1 NOT4 [Candida margitis]
MTTMILPDDSFISDDEEEYCPLCVEEMDISDKNFKPCPCGYQICQFCYNNIRSNPELNGRCPGCRRLYDDESVEYKTISPEEYKIQQARKEKREREKKQREKEKKESDMANKKHLAGLRVVQKNLVYVTGLNPPCNPDELHSVLRSDKYFGQYGKINKIVINKKNPNPQNSGSHHHQNPGLVVYVTFARKEDALNCITELDGSLCDGRVLRAAHGTTKYCSSYLRGHPCPNPNCMFLHEPGEEADSFTRKDLSTQQGIKMGMTSRAHTTSFGEETYIPNHQLSQMTDEDLQQYQQQHGHYNNNHHASHQHPHNDLNKEHLPATAHWANINGQVSGGNSPTVNNNVPLANSAAFPTLGEIARERQQQQRKEPKSRVSSTKISKVASATPADEVDLDDNTVMPFIESIVAEIKSLDEIKNVKFKNFSDDKPLPLFAFGGDFADVVIKPDDEKLLARQVIEKYLLRPIKNYHLAYPNHPIMQQQTLLQRQQQQQQQQGTPVAPVAQLQEKTDEQLLLLRQLQQQQQLQQLQQQQQQQQQQLNQLNMIKSGDRVNTSTPPPPGLFTGRTPTAQNEIPLNASGAPQRTSSQLLTQLMSKK